MNRPIRLIAVDLDGTLLNSAHQVTPRTEHALRQAMRLGVPVVLATGKTRASAVTVIEELELTTPGVYLQGLALYNGDGSILYQQTLDPTLAALAIELAEAGSHPHVMYSGDHILTAHRNAYTDKLIAYHEPAPQQVASLTDLLGRVPVHKVTFIDEPARVAQLRGQLSERVGDQATLTQALDNMLEILPVGASKGDGLRRLLDILGVASESVLALGDGENDIGMLQLAGIGVAMGNARPAVQAAADYVTASHDADGVAEAVERFVLAL